MNVDRCAWPRCHEASVLQYGADTRIPLCDDHWGVLHDMKPAAKTERLVQLARLVRRAGDAAKEAE